MVIMNIANRFFRHTFGIVQTLIIFSILISLIFYFYFGSGGTAAVSLVWQFILLTLFTDFIYVVLHLFRRPVKHENISFDPKKLSIVIACYNGEDIIGKTIENCLRHVPDEQIIIVSDASKDRTAEVAQSYGVRVAVNRRNLNKAFSISSVVKHVHTEYTLILDDDTLIGDIIIPTSLLDDGYSAVAFNVMPMEHPTIVNKLQQFEYRKSMFMGKDLRAKHGAIGNISGAVGLYRTSDLVYQVRMHSGQFGGEDQQRTALVHIYGAGKGVTYTDQVVLTEPPATPKALFKQRTFRWNLSLPELFSIYGRILFSPRHHYMLKVEKAYQIFLYTTDPFRVLFFWVALFYPTKLLIYYAFYILLSSAVWIKMDRKDPFWVVAFFPVYRQLETVCRIIAQFYWIKIKAIYIFREKFHHLVKGRKVVYEYGLVLGLISVIWIASVTQSVTKFEDFSRRNNVSDAELQKDVIIDREGAEAAIDKYGAQDPQTSPQSYLINPQVVHN